MAVEISIRSLSKSDNTSNKSAKCSQYKGHCKISDFPRSPSDSGDATIDFYWKKDPSKMSLDSMKVTLELNNASNNQYVLSDTNLSKGLVAAGDTTTGKTTIYNYSDGKFYMKNGQFVRGYVITEKMKLQSGCDSKRTTIFSGKAYHRAAFITVYGKDPSIDSVFIADYGINNREK